MADTIKISQLTEIGTGELDDNSIVPVVDAGTTYKLPITKLKVFLGESFATDSELSSQISSVTSTISSLTTDNITEGTDLYYTDGRVKTKLNSEGVVSGSVVRTLPSGLVSGSSQVIDVLPSGTVSGSDQIEDLGFITSSGDATLPAGVISGSQQVIDALPSGTLSGSITTSSIQDFPTEVSRSAAEAGFGAGGGGSSTDYISNITLSNSTLTFTGVGSAFNSTINLAVGGGDGGNLATTSELGNYLEIATWSTESGSFASRIDNISAVSVPAGTISSSAQVVLNDADFTSFDTDAITEGLTNQYYTNTKVENYINSKQVLSGSVDLGGFSGAVSTSAQIENLGFYNSGYIDTLSQSLSTEISSVGGVQLVGDNRFEGEQTVFGDLIVTGSIKIDNSYGAGLSFSGSGANLYGIPSSSIVGLSDFVGSTTKISDGNVTASVSPADGFVVTSLSQGSSFSGSVDISGSVFVDSNIVVSGYFSGSGENLTNIPQSAIVGGVGSTATKLASGSLTASLQPSLGFVIDGDVYFNNDVTVSGSLTAGTVGSPTLISDTNINLSASNAVIINSSPLRIGSFTTAEINNFSLSQGDIWYDSTIGDLFILDGANSQSLTSTTLQSGLVSGAQQLTSESSVGQLAFVDNFGEFDFTASLTYTANQLQTNQIDVTDNVSIGGNLTLGGGAGTGSFQRIETSELSITGQYNLPTTDGSNHQVLVTDGSGNISFDSVPSQSFQGNEVSASIVKASTEIQSTAFIGDTMLLNNSDSLPAGQDGLLAVSQSKVYFYSASWKEIAFV